MTDLELKSLESEFKNDTLDFKYKLKSVGEIYNSLNFRNLISSTTLPSLVTFYNATQSTTPEISATNFINLIPFNELNAVKQDVVGVTMYDRLLALESQGGIVNVTESEVLDGVSYCYGKALLSVTTKNTLVGTYQDNDPNWQSMIPDLSRIETLFGVGKEISLEEVKKVVSKVSAVW